MFRALSRPSSGDYNCISSLWFYRWSVVVAALLVVVWPVMGSRGVFIYNNSNRFLITGQTTTNNTATTTLQPEAVNPLNAELNPICYLLALLGAHHFLHVSRIWVKSLTLRQLMSYIHMEHLFLMFLDHTQRRTTVGRTPLDE